MFRFTHSNLKLSALFVFILLLANCSGSATPESKPTVIIAAPPSGSSYNVGEPVAVQSTSADPLGIVRVELLVDGAVVRTDPAPVSQGQVQFAVIQTWAAIVPGSHTLTVRAYNTQNAFGEAGIVITVKPSGALPTVMATMPIPATGIPTVPPPPPPPTAVVPTSVQPTVPGCVLNSQFVADLSVPDGTQMNPGTPFTKSWRVLNTGTCAWDSNFRIAMVSGTNLAPFTQTAIPPTAPGATADISLPMTAPNATGAFRAVWRLTDANGQFFGTDLIVSIVVGTPAPTATKTAPPASCSGTPNDFTFTVTPATIAPGQAATLAWGAITNANGAFLDEEGVETPGSQQVNPTQTQTYTLVAVCGNNKRTKQVTLTVASASPTPTPGFEGHWNIKNGGEGDCTADFTVLKDKISGTFCRKLKTGTSTGALQGTVSLADSTQVAEGTYTADSTNGTFKFYLSSNGNRFQGSWLAFGTTLEFCGWRDGSSPPNQCLR